MVKSRDRRIGKTESAHAGGVESQRLKKEKGDTQEASGRDTRRSRSREGPELDSLKQ